jgi:hypothetical protein
MHGIIVAASIAISKQASSYRKVFDQIVREFKPLLRILQFHAYLHRFV